MGSNLSYLLKGDNGTIEERFLATCSENDEDLLYLVLSDPEARIVADFNGIPFPFDHPDYQTGLVILKTEVSQRSSFLGLPLGITDSTRPLRTANEVYTNFSRAVYRTMNMGGDMEGDDKHPDTYPEELRLAAAHEYQPDQLCYLLVRTPDKVNAKYEERLAQLLKIARVISSVFPQLGLSEHPDLDDLRHARGYYLNSKTGKEELQKAAFPEQDHNDRNTTELDLTGFDPDATDAGQTYTHELERSAAPQVAKTDGDPVTDVIIVRPYDVGTEKPTEDLARMLSDCLWDGLKEREK